MIEDMLRNLGFGILQGMKHDLIHEDMSPEQWRYALGDATLDGWFNQGTNLAEAWKVAQ